MTKNKNRLCFIKYYCSLNNYLIRFYAQIHISLAKENRIVTKESVGLEINVTKTKRMIVWRDEVIDHVHPNLEVGQYKFKRVQEFKNLGSIMTQKKKR